MSPKCNPLLVRTFRVLLGLFVLVLAYRAIRSELRLREYQRNFLQIDHPSGTARVDVFGLKADYYPATYVDASIQFRPVSWVGELREYTGDWNDIRSFYHNQTREDGGTNPIQIMVLPAEMQVYGQKTSFTFSENFSYGPSEYDMLEELKRYYQSEDVPQVDTKKKLYLVYVTHNR